MKLEKSESKIVHKLFELYGEPSSKTKYNIQAIVKTYHEGKLEK